MEIISHRGFWTKEEEKNTTKAFIRAFENGFGVETDIRDLNRKLVISHDPPCGASLLFESFAQIYEKYSYNRSTISINIKADGLHELVRIILEKYNVKNYFVFDMSGPDTLNYIDTGLTVFSRQSEIELDPICYERISGVWVDCFYREWIEKKQIYRHLNAGKKVCLVSPELHRRSHIPFWKFIKTAKLNIDDKIMLCTDYPNEAKDFFHG